MWSRRNEVKPVSYPRGPWDGLTPVQIARDREPRDMRHLRSMLIDDFLSSRTFSAGVFVGDRINPDTTKAVRRSMDIPKDDILKIVIDGTHFGSAKNGFVFSSDGLYWKEFWGNPQFTNWEALSIAQTRHQLVFNSSKIIIDNAIIKMTFGFYSAKDVEDIITGILQVFYSIA